MSELIKVSKFHTRKATLPAGPKRIVHVLGPVLAERLEKNDHSKPIVAVRDFDYPDNFTAYRHVEIHGPSILMDTPEMPLPGTQGRGVCYLVTEAELTVYEDDMLVTQEFLDGYWEAMAEIKRAFPNMNFTWMEFG